MIRRNVTINGHEMGMMQGDSVEQLRQYIAGIHGDDAVIEIASEEWTPPTCPECGGRLIGCDYPYCPDCRDRETAARQAKSRANAQRRCRDCGAYGPTDARGLGWNCGCASE